MATKMPSACLNCRKPRPVTAKRFPHGLCWRCYRTPGVAVKYPPLKRGHDKTARRHREPTEAELDELIERQRADLPAWWQDECDREPLVYTLVRC